MDVLIDAAVSALSLLIVGFYAWSLKGHFSSPRMPRGAKIISAAVIATSLFFLFQLWSQPQPPLAQATGLCIEILAGLLFFWAMKASRTARLRFAFDPENPHSIVSGGPYKYLRHPFYTSYLLFWAGWALASWSIWGIVPVVFFTATYVMAARGEERNFSNSDLAADYHAYRAQTGFLFPKF